MESRGVKQLICVTGFGAGDRIVPVFVEIGAAGAVG
jgi:hypothetical protein